MLSVKYVDIQTYRKTLYLKFITTPLPSTKKKIMQKFHLNKNVLNMNQLQWRPNLEISVVLFFISSNSLGLYF